ncbi:MAG: class I SAM-dependent methyltransferase [Candidatus Dormibacteria bacterium]
MTAARGGALAGATGLGTRDFDPEVGDTVTAQVGLAFDALAAGYDLRESSNSVRRWMRERSLTTLCASFPMGAMLLDLGAGTGTEAVTLCGLGRRVVAVEPSGAMCRQLERKAQGRGLRLPVHRLEASRLHELQAIYGTGHFDGAYSSFGALNLEADLTPVARSLAALLRPGAPLVISVLNRYAMTEMLLYGAALRPRTALRRLGGTARFSGGGAAVTVHYSTVAGLRRSFSPSFVVECIEALPLFQPPPNVARRLAAVTPLIAVLRIADRAFARHTPLNRLGDHLLVVMRRRD